MYHALDANDMIENFFLFICHLALLPFFTTRNCVVELLCLIDDEIYLNSTIRMECVLS